jgi:NAD(P)-dependent dehydrogenase (short-subunit alcohol dehydrogenase family)
MKAFDKADIIVNNAGTSRAMPFEKVTDEILYDDLELKLFPAVRLIRLVAPQMEERRWGRIVNVLNIGAKTPRPNSMPTSIPRAAGINDQGAVVRVGTAQRADQRSESASSAPTSMCNWQNGPI